MRHHHILHTPAQKAVHGWLEGEVRTVHAPRIHQEFQSKVSDAFKNILKNDALNYIDPQLSIFPFRELKELREKLQFMWISQLSLDNKAY